MATRDVINHLLFEVSTEVYGPQQTLCSVRSELIPVQGQQSRRHLLRPEVQGARNLCRV